MWFWIHPVLYYDVWTVTHWHWTTELNLKQCNIRFGFDAVSSLHLQWQCERVCFCCGELLGRGEPNFSAYLVLVNNVRTWELWLYLEVTVYYVLDLCKCKLINIVLYAGLSWLYKLNQSFSGLLKDVFIAKICTRSNISAIKASSKTKQSEGKTFIFWEVNRNRSTF